MKLLSVIGLFILVACGRKFTYIPTTKVKTIEVEKIIEVDRVIEIEKEIQKIIEVSQKFEGFYHLENGGIIELMANHRGDVTIESTGQQILSPNPQNSTIAEHPRIVGADIQIINDKLKWSRNENYTAGQDVEEDVSGANIVGLRKTDYTLELDNKGKLKITIKIWNDKIGNNVNNIIASRVIKQEI